MDTMMANMFHHGTCKFHYARVLFEIEANKEFMKTIKGTNRHILAKCGKRPRNEEDIAVIVTPKEANVYGIIDSVNKGFVEVNNKKKRSLRTRRHIGRVVEFEEAPNKDESKVERESDSRRPLE
ncbi:hypothetical protein Tco_1233853 [Tanacetum coccineum]